MPKLSIADKKQIYRLIITDENINAFVMYYISFGDDSERLRGARKYLREIFKRYPNKLNMKDNFGHTLLHISIACDYFLLANTLLEINLIRLGNDNFLEKYEQIESLQPARS